ncbi:hypothetical protein NDU88_004452 [Pleurodeles waltl]|uniref:Uncharacterized protein n=1 Tax=Pleurodeles waltl TaxID=8319 RepID=A0AAV7RIT8_PLEWA|nr:hypothetical protein NDU88_004452 [Pleurodeles waltl]
MRRPSPLLLLMKTSISMQRTSQGIPAAPTPAGPAGAALRRPALHWGTPQPRCVYVRVHALYSPGVRELPSDAPSQPVRGRLQSCGWYSSPLVVCFLRGSHYRGAVAAAGRLLLCVNGGSGGRSSRSACGSSLIVTLAARPCRPPPAAAEHAFRPLLNRYIVDIRKVTSPPPALHSQ